MDINVNDMVAKPFHKLFKPFFQSEIDEIVLKGGRNSAKSSFASIVIVVGMMMDYHMNNEITHALCIRKVGTNLRQSVYRQIVWAINILGVSEDWKCNKSPLECIYKPSGQQIIFSGCDDPLKLKGLKFSEGFCKYTWFEEVNQFLGMEEVRNVIQSSARGGDHIILYSFNPPPSKNNWCNYELTTPKNHRIIHHSTYLDNKWLSPVTIRIAEDLKLTNYQMYENEYLGLPVGLGGEIFNNIVDVTLSEENIWSYDKLRNGLDFGASDPTAFTHLDYDNDKKEITFLSEIYSPFILIDPLYQEISQLIEYHELIRADSREKTTIAELKHKGLNIIAASKPPDSVRHGVKWLQGCNKLNIDRKRCPKTYWEFSTYERARDKFGNFINEFPDKNNHLIDATRYALSDIINSTGWKVPKVRRGGI